MTAAQTEDRRQRRRRPPASAITPETPIWCPACVRKSTRRGPSTRNLAGSAGSRDSAERLKPPSVRLQRGRRKLPVSTRPGGADPQYKAKSLKWQQGRRQRLGATHDLRRVRRRLQAIVDEWKHQGCIDCGVADIRAIDPDHLDGSLKSGHLSRLVQLCASAARIRAELAKCVPRCARCHRRVTQEQRPCKLRNAERLPPSWRRRRLSKTSTISSR